MVSDFVTITETHGLHMRPAGLLARALSEFSSTVEIVVGENRINAKSVMAIIAASIQEGAKVEICCEGIDEEAALCCAVEMLSNNN